MLSGGNRRRKHFQTTPPPSGGPTASKILLSTVLVGTVAICAIVKDVSAAAAPHRLYTYRVNDSIYGAIGTYSNEVEKIGNATTVTTEARIRVSFLGVVLYDQDASRIERWVNGRLVSFHGVTTENGRPTAVDGYAEADHFIVISPRGKVTAPGTIRTANPQSASAPAGNAILMPDTGVIEKVSANVCEESSITIDGASTRALRCQIETVPERYEVWTDNSGTPLMFNIQDQVSTITFTLVR